VSSVLAKLPVLILLLPALAAAQSFRVYVGNISTKSVLLAWGTTVGGENTIGRKSRSHGKAQVKVGDRTAESKDGWAEVDGLKPDTEYAYEVVLNDQKIGEGRVRTYPEKSDRLAFFVIGDFGNGSRRQYRVAEEMWKEFERKSSTDNPVRFVLTTGDNIYADVSVGLYVTRSGDDDSHWESKFFRPYKDLIARIPFYPSIGNHDGNSSERRADLDVYLDNFFFPDGKPHRWYSLTFGGLAEFFAMDSSNNTDQGKRAPVYLKDGEQFDWLQKNLRASKAPWKIPYFHHPPYTAGPNHAPNLEALRHFVDAFEKAGVKVVFTGHEHNFQYSLQSATGGVRYVVSGAGGELRGGNVLRKMAEAKIEGWSAQPHFLSVEIYDKTLKITPISYEPMVVRDADGRPVPMPLEVYIP